MNAEVRIVNGVPELFLDGQLQTRMWSRPDLPSFLAVDKIDEVRHAGIDIHLTSLHQPQLLCWDGGAHHDCGVYEAFATELVRYQPAARLILYLGIRTAGPYKWVKRNRTECTRLSNGGYLDAPSVASTLWHEQSSDAIARIVRHFERCPIADHVIGYNFVMGGNEWFSYGAYHTDPVKQGFADYSEPMQSHYRAWTRARYGGNVEALRESWRDSRVTFEDLCVPSADERLAFGHEGQFFPFESMGNRLVDWYHCWHEAWADMALRWCRAAKEASGRKILCGLMNAYSYCGAHVGGFTPSRNYGGALRILASPYVDFVQSPYHYYNRSFPGTHYSQHAEHSVLLHGKLLLDQLDTKTHLKNDDGKNSNARTPYETEQVLRRDVANSLTRNCHCYWMEIHRGVFGGFGGPESYKLLDFDDPDIRGTIAALKKLSDENQRAGTANVSEVAFFSSKEAPYRMRPENLFTQFHVDALRQWILPHIGTPFDDYILEDFPSVLRDYRVYLFPNAFYVPAALRAAIRARIEAGATAVFFYAPGYLDETGASLDHVRALTGLTLDLERRRDWLQVEIGGGHPFVRDLAPTTDDWWESPRPPAPLSYGTDIAPELINRTQEWLQWPGARADYRFCPVFHSADGDAAVLGTLRGTGRPGLVVKPLGQGKVVYSAAPLLPACALRRILADAGAHLYSPCGSLVYASSGYLSVTSARAGRETVLLPAPRDVCDAFTGERVATAAARFVYEAQYGETRIFRLAHTGEREDRP